jgi:hypothetical protein
VLDEITQPVRLRRIASHADATDAEGQGYKLVVPTNSNVGDYLYSSAKFYYNRENSFDILKHYADI